MVPLWHPSFGTRDGRHLRCGQSAVCPSRAERLSSKNALDGFALSRGPWWQSQHGHAGFASAQAGCAWLGLRPLPF